MILNAFQLRSARSALNIGVREIGSIIEVSRTTISVWENQRNFEYSDQHDNSGIYIRKGKCEYVGQDYQGRCPHDYRYSNG